MNSELRGRLYYSSSEVSEMLDLEPSVLRFWEDQFSQLRVKRNRAGKRMYREKDIEVFRTIKRLTRDEGYTIAGAKKQIQESSTNRAGAKKQIQESVHSAAKKESPPEPASESEVLQWIRNRLIEMRKEIC